MMCVIWNLGLVTLEIVLVSVQDSHRIFLEINLDAPDGTSR